MRNLCVVFLVLLFAFSACFAETTACDGELFGDTFVHNIGSVQFSLPGEWTAETQADGSTYYYAIDDNNAWVFYTIIQNPKVLSFEHDYNLCVAYMEGVFSESGLWSSVQIISRDGIYGCAGSGYVEEMPAASVFVETAEENIIFLLADAASHSLPADVLGKLISFLPWINEQSSPAQMIDFQLDAFKYNVPVHWTHKVKTDENGYSHSFDDGNVYYSVTLHSGPDDTPTSAMDYLEKLFPAARYDLVSDGFHAIVASGTTRGGMDMVKACVFNGFPYLEVTYNNANVDIDTMREEFMELFKYVEIVG